jgi:hypothetical protein
VGITLEFDEQLGPAEAAQAEFATRDVLGHVGGDWEVRFFSDSGKAASYGVRVRSHDRMIVRIFDGRNGIVPAARVALNSAVAKIQPRT